MRATTLTLATLCVAPWCLPGCNPVPEADAPAAGTFGQGTSGGPSMDTPNTAWTAAGDDSTDVEPGTADGESTLTGTPGQCGNGEVEGAEECDDANDEDNDACGNDCTRRCADGEIEVETCLSSGRPLAVAGLRGELALTSFNDNPWDDLVVIGQQAATVFLDPGNAAQSATVTLELGAEPTAVATGDVDGDGHQDVVVGLRETGGVRTYLGNGDGAFELAQASAGLLGGGWPIALQLGDIDNDGTLDLAATMAPSSIFSSLTALTAVGDGTGEFTSSPAGQVSASTFGPVLLDDLDDDGSLDLAVAAPSDVPRHGSVRIYWGDGSFVLEAFTRLEFGSTPFRVTAGDLNGDGIVDLLSNDPGLGTLIVLFGEANRDFGAPVQVPAGAFPTVARVGDLNGDEIGDLVVANAAPDLGVTILQGADDGTMAAGPVVLTPGYAQGLVLGELNGDGVTDFAVASPGTGQLSLVLSQP